MKFTKEQQNAIDARNSDILVSAAAGSGKTAVLVERIITLITDPKTDVNIDNLLIVTFTEAAGKEMRHRLEKKLSELLETNPNDANLRKQLVLLNRAYISTIHSFCKKIISQNFSLLEIDTTFRIADELEKKLLEDEILDEVLEGYYSKEDNEVFKHLLEMYSENIEDNRFREVIYDIYKHSLNHTQPLEWVNSAKNIHSITTLSGSKIEKATFEIIKQNLVKCMGSTEQALELIKVYSELEKAQTLISEEYYMYLEIYNKINNSTYDEIFNICKNYSFTRYPSINSKKLDLSVADVAVQAKDLRDSAKKYFSKIADFLEDDEETTINNLNFLSPYIGELCEIVINFSNRLMEEKYKKNILTFNDLEQLAIKLLVEKFENGEPVYSDTARKYQQRFAEIIIDEYQDTNEVQDLILTAISRHEQKKPNKFMVGDVKQSIYKFRGGDPKLFINKYNNYTYDEESRYKKIDLSKNFRSSHSVIQLVNFVFLQLMQKDMGGISYDDNAKLHLGREEDEKLTTEVLLCDFESKNDEAENDLNSKVELEFEVIAKKIVELTTNIEKTLEYKDIVILLRSRTNIDLLTNTLKKYRIPTSAKTIGEFYDNYEIQLILSYLQIIDNPLNDIPLLTILKSPIYNITDDELVEIATYNSVDSEFIFVKVKDVYENSKNKILVNKLDVFFKDYNLFKEVSFEMSISEFLLYMYETTEILGIVKAFKNGSNMTINLMYLIEKAVDFEKTSYSTVFNFVKYIEKVKTAESKDNVKTFGDVNSVKIMTIHESKGLEFPVVFVSNLDKWFNFRDTMSNIITTYDIPFTSKVLDPKTRIRSNTLLRSVMADMLKSEIIAEELRIFYVALTRAKEKLILTSYISDLESRKKAWNDRFNTNELEMFSSDVLSSKSYLDFLMKPLYSHKSAYFLHDYDNKINGLYDFDLPINIEVIKASNFVKMEEVESIKSVETVEETPNFFEEEYCFKDYTTLQTFTTISEIKRKLNPVEQVEFEGSDVNVVQKSLIKTEPSFLLEEKLTPTRKGTAIHKVFEKINFTEVVDLDVVTKCLDRLVLQNQITDIEMKAINVKKVLGFFESDIYTRILKSKNVYKEQIFTLGLPSGEVYPELKNTVENVNIVVKGMIDCLFEEEDGYVLLDFKTDYVTNDTIQSVVDNYRVQIDLYAKAVDKALDKNVKEKYIYFYNLNKFVKVE